MENSKFIETATEYLDITNKIKELEAKKKMCAGALMAHLKENGSSKLLCEGVGDVQIVHSTKRTPQAKAIEEQFNITLTPECFKTTESEYVKVLPLIVEG